MKNLKYIIYVGIIAALGACSTTANLYPVKGPLAEKTPAPNLVAKVDGIMGNTGNFTLTMPNGSECSGKWSSVAPTYAGVASGSLFGAYGSVTGFGTTVGIVPGVNKGQAVANCTDNTRIDLEFFTGSGTANGYGIAKDTNGNIYKVIF